MSIFTRSEKHQLWVLDESLEVNAPLGGDSAINDSVITTKRYVHHVGYRELVVS